MKKTLSAVKVIVAVTLWLAGAACWLKGNPAGGAACYAWATCFSVWSMASK